MSELPAPIRRLPLFSACDALTCQLLPEGRTNRNYRVDAGDQVYFVRLSVPTPGASNAHPWVGPVVISEILYSRDDLARMTGYVELYNTSNANASIEVSVEVGVMASPLFVEGPITVPAQKRVLLADRSQKRLLLFAEMKLPGEAWLEFKIDHEGLLHQTATFRPKGLLGRMYWYAVLPFHVLIFKGMIRKLGSA